MRSVLRASLLAATVFVLASPASAATLTITDTFGGSNSIWMLTIGTGCTTCAGTLTAFFQDPDGAGPLTNGYTGTYIDSVQWVIDGTVPTSVTLSAAPGGTSDWLSPKIPGSLNANQCGGNASNNVCIPTVSTGGVGAITNGQTLTWTFNETFASSLTTASTGNIRAAFDNFDGSNFNIFSPNGGDFGPTTTTTTATPTTTTATPTTTTPSGVSPEPTMLTLFGGGLVMAARKLRRRKNA